MVDKENQWDDIEYSDNEAPEQGYDNSGDEYSEQDYDNYDDYDEEDDGQRTKKKSNQLPLLIIALLLLGLAGFLVVSKMSANKETMEANADAASQSGMEMVADGGMSQGEDMGDSFFEQAGGTSEDMMSVDFNENGDAQVTTNDENGEIVATVKENNGDDLFGSSDDELGLDPSKENNDIIISYDKAARENPFKPPVYEKTVDKNVTIDNTQFEIIEPPTTSIPDENLTRLLQTQISGILYDEHSPSAIVNLNGMDSFVKVGDTISGYTIQAITRDQVQINYNNNSYVASVGELFTRGVLEKQRAVANLEKKFAGRYKD